MLLGYNNVMLMRSKEHNRAKILEFIQINYADDELISSHEVARQMPAYDDYFRYRSFEYIRRQTVLAMRKAGYHHSMVGQLNYWSRNRISEFGVRRSKVPVKARMLEALFEEIGYDTPFSIGDGAKILAIKLGYSQLATRTELYRIFRTTEKFVTANGHKLLIETTRSDRPRFGHVAMTKEFRHDD